jgi:beta-mannosidase
MNSIRIWGGGVYESDDFYDITDELGLLVWQDMMFACSMYPTDPDFLQAVDDETVYQVFK